MIAGDCFFEVSLGGNNLLVWIQRVFGIAGTIGSEQGKFHAFSSISSVK